MSSQPNILLLVHRVPYPPNRGDRIRSYHLLKQLASIGRVHLASLADEPLEPATVEVLNSLCAEVAIEPLNRGRWMRAATSLASGKSATQGLFRNRQLHQQIDHWADGVHFDAVVVFCSSMVQYLDVAGLQNVPVLVDLVDVDSQKFFDYAATAKPPKRWLYQLEAQRLRRLECDLVTRARAVTLVSEAEASIYRGFCDNDKTHALPNGVDLEYFRPTHAAADAQRCVFVGALDYPPNGDGAAWFCREVWPQVRQRHPAATFAIVGRNPPPHVQKLAEIPGVEVIGSVPDVRPQVAAAGVVIVPLRIARGIQNKVLEALAMGKPVIASPVAIEGLAVTPGEQLLSADSRQEWVDAIDKVFRDASLAKQLGLAGRSFVEQHHNWTTCLAPLAELLGLSTVASARQPLALAP